MIQSTKNNPKGIQILFPQGDPVGVREITIPGWEGACLMIPRVALRQIKDYSEATLPALYFLFGEDDLGQTQVYIGESESFFGRITNHHGNKDFWDTAVVFTRGLNRAFVKYLEYLATTESHNSGRMVVMNKVQPQENTLSDFEKVSVLQYFEEIKFILSALRYPIFEPVENSQFSDSESYNLEAEGVSARAYIQDNGSMLVEAGATARKKETESFEGWALTARKKYLNEGLLQEHDSESYVLKENTLFKSPSAAAAFLTGRSINGWTSWKDKEGNTMDDNLRTLD